MDLKQYLKKHTQTVDAALESYLPGEDRLPQSLHKAMRYSIFAGGKRIRPLLAIAACEAAGGHVDAVLPVACALEMIHTYSLIHDDLPAMDNDDFRRGRPTNHKVFGDANAILAGDALLTEAFVLLSGADSGPAEVRLQVLHLVARAAGCAGMVGGQVLDMESEGKQLDLPTLEYIHIHKTGALIRAALDAGALIGGARQETQRQLSRYGELIGLAFQITDDILDVVGDQSEIGKDVGSDAARGKATYVSLLGLPQSRQRANELRHLALESLADLGLAAEPLRQIANYVVERTS
jgi:geranylgeranyl diphosphate synthase type II